MISGLKRLVNRLLGRSDIVLDGLLYMRRWRLIHNKRFFSVRVHCIERSDADRDLHDHPFSFITILLKGSYTEETVDGRKVTYGPGSVLFRSAGVLHRLDVKSPVWTLVFGGPWHRQWGFLTSRGWVPDHDYFQTKKLVWGRSSAEVQPHA